MPQHQISHQEATETMVFRQQEVKKYWAGTYNHSHVCALGFSSKSARQKEVSE